MQYSKEDFEIAYKESVNRNGLPQKLEMRKNIKTFLTNRKKQLKAIQKKEQRQQETDLNN